MTKRNNMKWSVSMLINTALIIIHLCFILNGLYQIGFGFDLYPALGLLTYAFLSLGMNLSVFLLMNKKHKHANYSLLIAVLITLVLYSDLFFPGILLSTWNYLCVAIISVISYALVVSQTNGKTRIDQITRYSILTSWFFLSFLLISQISSAVLYLAMGISLVICTILSLVRLMTTRAK
jgi:hypothetical protein